jgi:hypothetical protein
MSLRSSPHHHTILLFVIMLAQPGIQGVKGWIPDFAGMTEFIPFVA